MRIRPARIGDVPAIEDIVERAYRGHVERIGRRPGPMDDDYVVRVRDGDVFVAEDASDGRVAGLIVLETEPDHVVIANVAVDPERQHAGIGRALLAHAEQFAVDRGVAEVRLFTHVNMTENQRLYRGLGYQETGREIGSDFELVHYSKALHPTHE